jgi:glycosyltransferase involved in cell wall biosynthesis
MAIGSVLYQTYQNWECIVVDDGSTDNTEEVVAEFTDSRIRYCRLQAHAGRAVARQKALDLATGDYLCMVDADDWIYPDKLEKQLEILESCPDVALVSSPWVLTDDANRRIGFHKSMATDKLSFYGPLNRLSVSLPVFHASSMIRMELAKGVSYNPRLTSAEDADFLLKVLWNKKYAIQPEPLYVYRSPGYSSFKRLNEGYYFAVKILMPYVCKLPFQTIPLLVGIWLKQVTAAFLFSIGMGSMLHGRHIVPLSKEQDNLFVANLSRLNECG